MRSEVNGQTEGRSLRGEKKGKKCQMQCFMIFLNTACLICLFIIVGVLICKILEIIV